VTHPSASNSAITSFRKARSVLGSATRISTTGRKFRQQLWIPPVLGLIGLLFAGLWIRTHIDNTLRKQQADQLSTLLRADVKALEQWMASEEDEVEMAAELPDVREPALEQLQLAARQGATNQDLAESPARRRLQAALEPWIAQENTVGYVLIDAQGRIVASDADTLIGEMPTTGYTEFISTVLAGQSLVSRPFPSLVKLTDEFGEESVGVPTMFVAAPLKDDDGKIVAVLGLRLLPGGEFTSILNVARMGDTGETYAFNEDGLLLSSSRFEDQLKRIGLQLNQKRSRSELTVQLRDPGVDLTAGQQASLPLEERPLTKMAASAIAMGREAGKSNKAPEIVVDVDGYRDYRGVPVVGAWTWLPKYGFGVATEIDVTEADQAKTVLRTAFWTMFGLLGLAALLLLGVTFLARRMEKKMRDAVVAAGQLGQYALEEKIGEGGMGSVFRGRHAMMRRPAAVKLLEPGKTTDVSIARFEREVQLTSQLNHPNTITIYDYGRTDEGIFYYAMEFLDGLSLEALVERYGPQPDGRVIHLLLQVCGSLEEAHSLGLIHRDIKPANIMLTCRGGVCDYVKLLDFGLVKAIDSKRQRALTAADAITGTPLYLPPESIADSDASDARSDIYSLGAVAYFLLTGHPVFESNSVMDIIRQHLDAEPVPPSQRTNRPISPELEQLVLKCLAKSPADRPQSASVLATALENCPVAQPWSAAHAQAWWQQYVAKRGPAATVATEAISIGRTLDASKTNPHS